MYFSNLLTFGLTVAMLDIAAASPQGQSRNGNNGQNNNGQNSNTNTNTNNGNDCNTANTSGNTGSNNAAALALVSTNVQSASDSNGNPTNGQAASLTDPANFINFCSGKTITNGQQNTAGSCNGIPMGDMPSKENMISSIIINPAPGDNIDADTTFAVQFQTTNLVAGTFTNPDDTYYAAPQQLSSNGQIIGHSHVTIQSLGNSLIPDSPPDPTSFAFFLGIDNAGNGDGLLSATVNGGLPAGNYRVCTLTSASNHQPVLMPVAQRGAQDDCTKFTVGGSGNNNQQQGNNQKSNNNGQNNGAAGTQSAAASTRTGTANAQNGAANTQNSGANGSATSDCNNQSNGNGQAQNSNSNQNQNQQQRGDFNRGGNRQRQRFAAREFIS